MLMLVLGLLVKVWASNVEAAVNQAATQYRVPETEHARLAATVDTTEKRATALEARLLAQEVILLRTEASLARIEGLLLHAPTTARDTKGTP